MTERTILASFAVRDQAVRCEEALRQEGFDVVQVDDMTMGSLPSAFWQGPVVEWGRYGYQPGMLDDRWTSASDWPPAVRPPGGDEWILTAVVPEEQGDHATRLIARYGGRLS